MTEAEVEKAIADLNAKVKELEASPRDPSSWNCFMAAVAPYVPGWRIWIAGLVGAAMSTTTHLTFLKPAAAPVAMPKAAE